MHLDTPIILLSLMLDDFNIDILALGVNPLVASRRVNLSGVSQSKLLKATLQATRGLVEIVY